MDTEKELEERIAFYEKYDFPYKFTKGDYFIAAAVILICLAATIGGAFL